MKEIELLTSAWYKDESYKIYFPDSWEHVIVGDQVINALPFREIQEKVFDPIGSPQMSELIDKDSKIAIIVDDLTRPTPLAPIMTILEDFFEKAGIPDESVNILVGSGAHEAILPEDIIKKIGAEAYSRFQIHIHDGKHNLVHLGKTSRGTPLLIHRLVMDCDIKIGLGCIYPHPSAGFSGGSKIVAPGIAGQETIQYMHEHLAPAGERAGPLNSEFRLEIEDIGAQVGLDYIINVVLNQYREIAGVFAGDPISAHREGVDFVRDIYIVQPMLDADIVIADMYPFDVDLQFAYDRGFWPLLGAKKSASRVILAACPVGLGSHQLYPLSRSLFNKYIQKLKILRLMDLRSPVKKAKKMYLSYRQKRISFMMLSDGLTGPELKTVMPNGWIYRSWDDILMKLENKHQKSPTNVAIYRCAPLFFPS